MKLIFSFIDYIDLYDLALLAHTLHRSEYRTSLHKSFQCRRLEHEAIELRNWTAREKKVKYVIET